MRYYFSLFLMVFSMMPASAQLESVKEKFTPEQLKIYQACTMAVSAPCCKNGQPVAEHESPVADQIKNTIKEMVLAGQSRTEILASIGEMTFGPTNEPVVFTVPKGDWIGNIVWALPAMIVALGIFLVFFFLSRQKAHQLAIAKKKELSDEDLLHKYRDRISHDLDATQAQT
jgi:cytochrome c-type biogenesis protein CcmH/NrfF